MKKKDKIIKILLDRIEELEVENALLHKQLDVIDVNISDEEAREILNYVKQNKHL